MLVRGYNYTFVLDRPEAADAHLAFACRVSETGSRRVLEVWTTKPGIDFYTSNFLDGSLLGLSGRTYRQSEGLAIEPEHFPHSPNRKNFPSTVLVPGKCYASATECRFSVGASTHHHHRNGSDDRVS